MALLLTEGAYGYFCNGEEPVGAESFRKLEDGRGRHARLVGRAGFEAVLLPGEAVGIGEGFDKTKVAGGLFLNLFSFTGF